MNTKGILDELPMTRMQVVAVALCIVLNAIDGFDVLAISFSAPGIAAEWSISQAQLGVVLAMELIGMAVGAMSLGNLADRAGRRPIILGCLCIMSLGMFLAAFADSVSILLVVRFATGLGIGGMLATINAMVAEYSNARRRNFNVSIMAAGYPLGVIVGGTIASVLLSQYDWRSVFVLGGIMTGVLIPFVWVLMPESISYLAEKRAGNALLEINAILKRMGHPAIEELPETEENLTESNWRDLFAPRMIRTTALLTASFFAHIMTFYFILKWIPKIVVDMGFTASLAGGVLVWANVGGAIGALMLGWLTHYYRLRALIIVALLGAVAMVNVFGQGQAGLGQLALVAGIAGFFTNSGVVGLYALFAQSFPTRLRAGGTGFAIGVGRAGAAMGPIIAGFLFEAGYDLSLISFVMALGSMVGAIMLVLLPDRRSVSVTSS